MSDEDPKTTLTLRVINIITDKTSKRFRKKYIEPNVESNVCRGVATSTAPYVRTHHTPSSSTAARAPGHPRLNATTARTRGPPCLPRLRLSATARRTLQGNQTFDVMGEPARPSKTGAASATGTTIAARSSITQQVNLDSRVRIAGLSRDLS